MKFSLIILALLLAGCGHQKSAVLQTGGGAYQTIKVDTPGMSGAACSLQSLVASYDLIAPQTVQVESSAYPLTVTCRKGPHFKGFAVLEPMLSRRTPGGGLYTYPQMVSVPMSINRRSLLVDDLVIF